MNNNEIEITTQYLVAYLKGYKEGLRKEVEHEKHDADDRGLNLALVFASVALLLAVITLFVTVIAVIIKNAG